MQSVWGEREQIDLFRGENAFLSNFYPVKMEYEGLSYCNAEAAYQAQKCEDSRDRIQFSQLYGNQAKRLGRAVKVRPDWQQVKVGVMEQVVEAKFSQNPMLARWLLETADKPLFEGNHHGDFFWGVDPKTGQGENHLGKILMQLREKYRIEGLPQGQKKYPVKRIRSIDGILLTDEATCQLAVSCIVNACDRTFSDGASTAIYREAGSELVEECRKLSGCAVGEAKITCGYQLKAGYVIHIVAPVYGKDDPALLEKCYGVCLDLASEHDIHVIAFPVISADKSCFPKQKASEIAVCAVRKWIQEHKNYGIEVVFACPDQKIYHDVWQSLQAYE